MMKTVNWNNLNPKEQTDILKRPVQNTDKSFRAKSQAIIDRVRNGGDAALRELTYQYDNVSLEELCVSANEMDTASKKMSPETLRAIQHAIERTETYHKALIPKAITVDLNDGIVCRREPRPIERVGLYVPGGSAPLVSTLIMLAIPAKLAGCPLRIVCTPPNRDGCIDPAIRAAAKLCGIQDIFMVGGAQSIAAMAYGTESIPKVDKIFGPGNSWVTLAKMIVSQDPEGASMDMPAGPSEVLIIADDKANPNYVAIDLLSQAEHGPDSQVLLITDSRKLAKAVQRCIEEELARLTRREIAIKSLEASCIIIVDETKQAVDISNRYAPEHLIINTDDAESLSRNIQYAGAVFLGRWTPETLGDYMTGSNHVLPTYGFARTFSGLSVSDFMTFISLQTVTDDGIKRIGPDAERLALLEGLDAHARAVRTRLTDLADLERANG